MQPDDSWYVRSQKLTINQQDDALSFSFSLTAAKREKEKDASEQRVNEKFVRWQRITLEQLGYVLNLVFTLTIAALGYWFALLRVREFVPGSSAKCALILSGLSLATAAAIGLWCSLNRLWDFRGTTKRAGDKPDAPSKEELDNIGKRTWTLFYIVLGGFAVGVVALAFSLLLTYGGKLA